MSGLATTVRMALNDGALPISKANTLRFEPEKRCFTKQPPRSLPIIEEAPYHGLIVLKKAAAIEWRA